MKIAIIGLGKMGLNIACNLKNHNYDVMDLIYLIKQKKMLKRQG